MPAFKLVLLACVRELCRNTSWDEAVWVNLSVLLVTRLHLRSLKIY